jgi:hypothetical protein
VHSAGRRFLRSAAGAPERGARRLVPVRLRVGRGGQVRSEEIARSIRGPSRAHSLGSAAPTTTVVARRPATMQAISR